MNWEAIQNEIEDLEYLADDIKNRLNTLKSILRVKEKEAEVLSNEAQDDQTDNG